MQRFGLVQLQLLHGVADSSRLGEHVAAFRKHAADLLEGPTDLFVGDAIEKGRTGPDRRSDLSGTPLFLSITPLSAGADTIGGATRLHDARERMAVEADKYETWVLRDHFERHSVTAVPRPEQDWLQIVIMNVDPYAESEFNEWYEQEHVARIAAVAPEFVSVRRLEAIIGSPKYAALWRMTDRKAPERDPWLSASETPWTTRIRRFMRDRRRLLLAPFAARAAKAARVRPAR